MKEKGGCLIGKKKVEPKKKVFVKNIKPETATKKSQQPAQKATVVAPKKRVAMIATVDKVPSGEYMLMSGYKKMPKVRSVQGGGVMKITGNIKFKAEKRSGDVKLTLLGENHRFLVGKTLTQSKLMKTSQFEKLVNQRNVKGVMGGSFIPFAEWKKANTTY
tara:strand:+ start:2275 stop:2757 length:483 start_codon:yes stop_codon:yes gene_type:complete